MTFYPIGYGSQTVTMDELRRVHEPHMHPEYGRRLWAFLENEGGHLGIGGGYRPPGTQPDKPGYAPPGKSFHEGQTYASGLVAYTAVDLVVPVPGAVHRAPTWSEVPAQGSQWAVTWGLHANVNNEPWHLQAIEQDGWDSWANTGRKDPRAGYPIPSDPTPPQPQPTPPGGDWTTEVIALLPTLRLGASGEDVETMQVLMSARGAWSDTAANHDGLFGSATDTYLRQFQQSKGLTVDGICGQQTWTKLLGQ